MLLLSQVVSPYSLMLIMILQGMTQSVSFMCLQASFLKQLPNLKVSQVGWQKSSVLLGFHLLGPVLGIYLIQSVKFTGTFLMISVILGLGIGLSLCRKQGEVARLGGNTLELPLGLFVQLKEMLTDRLLLQLMLVEALGSVSVAVFRTFVVPVMVGTLHLSVQTAPWLIITQGAASTVMILGGGRLLNLFSLNGIFGGGSFLIILGASLLAKATSGSTFWAGGVLFGGGTGLLALYNFARMSMAKGEAGKIAAMLSLSTTIGSIIGPVLGGFIGGTLTVQAAFWTPALALGLGGVIFAVVKKQQGVLNWYYSITRKNS